MNLAPNNAAPGLCVSEHEGGIVIFNPETGEFLTWNRTGALIWRGLSAGLTADEIATHISEMAGISLEQAKQDAARFIRDLERRRVLLRRRS